MRAQLTSTQRSSLQAVFVAIGGGGLIAGIAAYVKALHPGVKIIGVEPSGAPHVPQGCMQLRIFQVACQVLLVRRYPGPAGHSSEQDSWLPGLLSWAGFRIFSRV